MAVVILLVVGLATAPLYTNKYATGIETTPKLDFVGYNVGNLKNTTIGDEKSASRSLLLSFKRKTTEKSERSGIRTASANETKGVINKTDLKGTSRNIEAVEKLQSIRSTEDKEYSRVKSNSKSWMGSTTNEAGFHRQTYTTAEETTSYTSPSGRGSLRNDLGAPTLAYDKLDTSMSSKAAVNEFAWSEDDIKGDTFQRVKKGSPENAFKKLQHDLLRPANETSQGTTKHRASKPPMYGVLKYDNNASLAAAPTTKASILDLVKLESTKNVIFEKISTWGEAISGEVFKNDSNSRLSGDEKSKGGKSSTWGDAISKEVFRNNSNSRSTSDETPKGDKILTVEDVVSTWSIMTTQPSNFNETSSVNTMDLGYPWPVKKEAVVEGDIVLGGLMMIHEREDSITCGPVMPQGGIQALEAMLYTLDRLNYSPTPFLPNITLGTHILDDCDKDTYGLEMAVDFIKGK